MKNVLAKYLNKTTLLIFMVSLLFPTMASAVDEGFYPSTDPVPEIPVGAHLEGDVLVWDSDPNGDGGGAPDGNYWASGVVPYVFSSNVTSTNQTRMINAMQQWENVANVNFRPWQSGDANWLFIQNATQNTSFVGPQGSAQTVNILNWTNQPIITHELAHALGVRHEQSRADRDTYVTINLSNVRSICGNNGTSSCTHNFDKISSTLTYSPYDFDSVMHYGDTAFAFSGTTTIDVKGAFNTSNISFVNQAIGPDGQCFTDVAPTSASGGWQNGIGQRTHLSHWDCRMMSFIYPQANWRFLQPSRANFFIQVGVFNLPWDTLSESVNGTPDGGTLWIDSGTYTRRTINQPITLLAPKGLVRID